MWWGGLGCIRNNGMFGHLKVTCRLGIALGSKFIAFLLIAIETSPVDPSISWRPPTAALVRIETTRSPGRVIRWWGSRPSILFSLHHPTTLRLGHPRQLSTAPANL